MPKYIVSCVDYGDTCDGHARILGMFKDYSKALAFVKGDMKSVHEENGYPINYQKLEVMNDDGTDGSVWSIHDISNMEIR
jgi:hypothetical protein